VGVEKNELEVNILSITVLRRARADAADTVEQALGIRTIAAKPTSDGLFDDEVVRDALERIFSR